MAEDREAPTYLGDICEDHPKMKGRRYKSTGRCVGCRQQERAHTYIDRKREAMLREHFLTFPWPPRTT